MQFLRFILILFCAEALAQAPSLEWVIQLGGKRGLNNPIIKIDLNGNILITGVFSDTIDADPSPASEYLVSRGGYDVFLAKYDPSGNLIWATSFGGPSLDSVSDMATDNLGMIYLGGNFRGKTFFGSGQGYDSISSNGRSDGFIAKFDQNGGFEWLKRIGGPDRDFINRIGAQNGYAYLLGYFRGTVDFDPGPSSYNISSNGLDERFVAKFDQNGDFLFAKEFGIIPRPPHMVPCPVFCYDRDHVCFLDINDAGDIFIAGNTKAFGYRIDLYPGPGVLSLKCSEQTSYILRLDSAGNYQSLAQFEGSPMTPTGIYFSKQDQVVSFGKFYLDVDFDPGPGTKVIRGEYFDPWTSDNYVSTLTSSFSYSGAFKIGGIKLTEISNVASDHRGMLYLIGGFYSTVDFDPGPGLYNLTASGISDGFLEKVKPNGNLIWAIRAGGDGAVKPTSVAIGPNGEIYEAGVFTFNANFDPSGTSGRLTSLGDGDIYLRKISDPLGIESKNQLKNVRAFPNPFTNEINIEFQSTMEYVSVQLISSHGQIIQEVEGKSCNELLMKNEVEPGIYFLKVQDSNMAVQILKVVKK